MAQQHQTHEQATSRDSAFRCVRRGTTVTVDGCLTSRAAAIPKCIGCEVGKSVAARFQPAARQLRAPVPAAPVTPAAPRRSLPVVAEAPAPRRPAAPAKEKEKPARLPSIPDLDVPAEPAWRGRVSFEDAGELAPLAESVEPRVPAPFTAVFPRTAGLLQGLRDHGLYELADAIARRHSLPLAEMMGPARTATPIRGRAVLATLLKRCYRKSWPEIGRLLGRDHGTVMSAVASLPPGTFEDLLPALAPYLDGAAGEPASDRTPTLEAAAE